MLRFFCRKRGQNFLEYTVLVLVIAAAFMAMNVYMRRAINARLKQIQTELNESKR